MLQKTTRILKEYRTLQELVRGGNTDYIPLLIDLDKALSKCKYESELRLYYCDGYTMGEIASILDISIGTVSYRVGIGISELRDILGGDYFGR